MENKNEFIKLYCPGCGALLQNDDPLKSGFVPKKLEAKSNFLCQRCFRLQHYGEAYEDIHYSNDYQTIISKAKQSDALIVYVVDLFAFDCSIINSLITAIKDARVAVICSKRDVIPSSVKDEKLINFVRYRLEEVDIKPLAIMVSSAINNYNLDDILETCEKLRNSHDVYLFGAVSVGKSSLVNAFLKMYDNKTTEMITTSPYPGTTLNVIRVPIDEKSYVYDTPGIMTESSIFAHVDRKLLKYVLPRKEIKPRVFQLLGNQSLIVNNLAKIDVYDKANLIIFMSNDLEIRRAKLDRSDTTFNNLIKNKQFKLLDRNVLSVDDLQEHNLDVPHQDCDIVISGLLWIKIKGSGQKICVRTLKGVDVVIRECKI